MSPKSKYEGWTKYHIIFTIRHQWKFYREGMKRGFITDKDRNKVIREALFRLAWRGGVLFVHLKDGSVDFVIDNWVG